MIALGLKVECTSLPLIADILTLSCNGHWCPSNRFGYLFHGFSFFVITVSGYSKLFLLFLLVAPRGSVGRDQGRSGFCSC